MKILIPLLLVFQLILPAYSSPEGKLRKELIHTKKVLYNRQVKLKKLYSHFTEEERARMVNNADYISFLLLYKDIDDSIKIINEALY